MTEQEIFFWKAHLWTTQAPLRETLNGSVMKENSLQIERVSTEPESNPQITFCIR